VVARNGATHFRVAGARGWPPTSPASRHKLRHGFQVDNHVLDYPPMLQKLATRGSHPGHTA